MSWQDDFERMSEEEKRMVVEFPGRGGWWKGKTKEELEALSPTYSKARSTWWASITSEEKDEIFSRQSESLKKTISETPIEVKQERSRKKSETLSKRTPEEKAETERRKKETLENRTVEMKENSYIIRSLSARIGWKNMDQITRDERSAKESKSKEEMWASKSTEELEDIKVRQNISRRITLAGKSEEEKELRNARFGESMSKWWASLSPEERQKQSDAIREGLAKFWAGLSPEERVSYKLVPNPHEIYIWGILDTYFPGDWKYTGDRSFLVGRKNPDFTNINGKKAVIEYLGSYYHDPEYFPNCATEEELVEFYKEWGFTCVVLHEYLLCKDHIVEEVGKLYGGSMVVFKEL